MISLVFTYALPALLAYSLFVAISGRLHPLAWPEQHYARSFLILSMWIGICAGGATSLAIQWFDPANTLWSALFSVAILFIASTTPAFAAHIFLQRRHRQSLTSPELPNFDWAIVENDLVQASEFSSDVVTEHPFDAIIEDSTQQFDVPADVRPAYLAAAQIDQLGQYSQAEAVNDANDREQIAKAPESVAKALPDSLAARPAPPATIDLTMAAQQGDQYTFDGDLNATLAHEIALRKETETHLRITRKALSVLEAETRHYSIDEADAIIALEEKLAQSIEQSTALESDVSEEKTRRIELEHRILELKQKMVSVKQQIRKSAAARAEALGTANKSIAFARQSVQIRARLESELNEARATIKNRQKTISSLIRALEKEKRKTQSDVAVMARQLVLRERQVNARRSREQIARAVENKLTSRLVKKVAKARPILSDTASSEASQTAR